MCLQSGSRAGLWSLSSIYKMSDRYEGCICTRISELSGFEKVHMSLKAMAWVNPRVSRAKPAPVPVATRTNDQAVLPVKNNQKSAKPVNN